MAESDDLCSMCTVLTVKSEHMELTRGLLIACEMASYFFHVSGSITHGYRRCLEYWCFC
jgi:hypothetical protein